VRDLEETHGKRRDTVWASLNRAPLAHALRPLCALADATDAAVGGDAPEVVSEAYRQEGWRADAAALDALGSAREPRNAEASAAWHSPLAARKNQFGGRQKQPAQSRVE
jgi:hypothetical protein